MRTLLQISFATPLPFTSVFRARKRRRCYYTHSGLVIDRISQEGNAIASVRLSARPSVRPFVSILSSEQTDR